MAPAGVLVASFFLYLFTMAPTVIWGDSANFALLVRRLHLNVDADAHPLFIILGRLFSMLPFETAYSLNLLTAITASLAVMTAFLIIREITGSGISGIVGAAALALSHAFWLHAVLAEVYDLNAFFLLATVLLLLKWRKDPADDRLLYLAAFVFGLGLTNHLILALGAVGIIFIVVLTDWRVLAGLRKIFLLLCSFLTGSSLVLFLLAGRLLSRQIAAKGLTGVRYMDRMLVASPGVFSDLGKYFAYLFYQFPLAGFALGFTGIYAMLRKKRTTAIFLMILVVTNMIFFLTFAPGVKRSTKYTFYIADYAIFSVFIGYGFYSVMNYLKAKRRSAAGIFSIALAAVVIFPLSLYNLAPAASKYLGIDLLHARKMPYRDNESFFLNPVKRGYEGAERFGREALLAAEPDSIIIADYSIYTVLMYFQEIRTAREDVMIITSGRARDNIPYKTVQEYYGRRTIYLASTEKGYYRLRDLETEYDFVPEGLLYRVVRKDDHYQP